MALLALAQAHELIRDAINNGTKHDGYRRTCDLSTDYLTIITGKGWQRFLSRFVQRETKDELLQRFDLTHQNLSSTSNPIIKKADQLSRVQDIQKGLVFTDTSERDQRDLESVLSDFGGEGSTVQGSLEDYITRNYDQVSQWDPNAFLVMDFQPFNALAGERARPYAVRFTCDNVYNFRYTRGQLDFLLVAVYVTYKTPEGYKKTARDYISYCGPFALRYFERADGRADLPAGEEWESLSKGIYRVAQYNPGIDEVPAVRIGDLPDPETKGVTCISRLFHSALDQFKELINLKSLSDVVTRKHAYPRRYERAPECPGTMIEGGLIQPCNNGTNTVTGQKCTTCGGTGFEIHKSEQDTIRLKLTGQETKEDLFALSDLVFTEKPDLETITTLRSMVAELRQEIFVTVYSSDQQVQTQGPDISKTATEYVVSREDQNNTLLPIADQKSFIYKSMVRLIVKLMNISGEVKAPYEFSRDLKLTSADEILDRIAEKSSTVPSAVLESMYDDYFEKVYETNSDRLEWHYFKKDHIEFYLMPDSEFQFYVTSGYINEKDRTRRVYQERITNDLRNTVPNILKLSYKEQEAAIDKIVDEIMLTLPKPNEGLTEVGDNQVEDVTHEVVTD